MKLCRVYILLSFIIFSTAQRPANKDDKFSSYYTKFRRVDCESFDNSTGLILFCFVKPVAKRVASLNIGFDVLKPLNTIHIQIIAFFRYGNIYREIIDTKIVDYCGAMSGSEFNMFTKLIFDIVKASNPKMFHKCPYEGKIEYYNLTVDNDIAKKWSVFPHGQYK